MGATLTLSQPATLLHLRQTARFALESFGAWLSADLLTGLVHWWEDAYAQADWPVLGPLVAEPNLQHHRDPRAMTRLSWWRNIDVPALAALLALAGLHAVHLLRWPVALTLILAGLTNLVHRWAHQTPTENGRVITWLQARGLLQSRAQHALHHRWPRKTHYCPLTNLLNPVLERIAFWRRLERLILRVTGFRRRREPRPGEGA